MITQLMDKIVRHIYYYDSGSNTDYEDKSLFSKC